MAAALTQMTHAATQHNVPIMATHTQQTSAAYIEDPMMSRDASFPIQQTYYDMRGASGDMDWRRDGAAVGRGKRNYNINERKNSADYGLR